MCIGRRAELTSCTPKAIRLYEQMGLINEPERDGRYRTLTIWKSSTWNESLRE
ncbi:DNA-binding transcriptional MerR regulator [Pseudomonas sp. Tn43]|uniref:MerR family DNA-binding transcriptional regulator n=1 Tax=unclassified Pseudomonas TaxID=196821 RepID=UPI0017BF9436|nr:MULTISPECIES: MerR family DNA-binding transcriptional regulator [unclassified Pseudomonas]MBB3239098.1 DNA-binding transcriptional MerR regulator [Pseudomonas sp. Tn43]